MKFHGNSKQSAKEHHLYEIVNSETNELLKYGISGKLLNSDGSSPRANEQLKQFNIAAGWLKFFSNILLFGIPGRLEAKRIEKEYIQKYIEKNGKRPDGNLVD
ncbi:MAG: hypothetical protein H7A25_12735 [Leptospiraceae bacterium]|nr:hypothetical protein [Leptospiraceae bacterium]MCP5500765.1 hypothetical protein [Leptospiraceae bacterium]